MRCLCVGKKYKYKYKEEYKYKYKEEMKCVRVKEKIWGVYVSARKAPFWNALSPLFVFHWPNDALAANAIEEMRKAATHDCGQNIVFSLIGSNLKSHALKILIFLIFFNPWWACGQNIAFPVVGQISNVMLCKYLILKKTFSSDLILMGIPDPYETK